MADCQKQIFPLCVKEIHHCMSDIDGVAVGLYENHEAFILFMLAGPDCTRCIKEFETVLDLVALHTQEVMEEEVVTSLTQLQNIGKDLHAEFVSHTIEQVTSPITNTLKRQEVLTFANPLVHTKNGTKSGSAQRKSSLITKLFLSLQSRPDADTEEFFRYKNQREPPSLSNQGSLRSGKSDILV